VGTVILEATTLGARWGAVGTSALLHAGIAIAVVAAGHSAEGRGTSAPRQVQAAEAEVVEIAAPEIASESLQPLPSRAAAHAGAPRTHTHPYPVPNDHDATPHDPSLVHAPLASPPAHPHEEHEAAEAPAVTTAAESAPARFTIAVGAAAIAQGGASSSIGTAEHADSDAIVLPEAAADTPARFVGGYEPAYPTEAAAAGIETDVPLEIVIDTAGRVAHVRVVKAVGYGLDTAAARTVRTYRFEPATHDGRPVAVRRAWNVTFRLR